MNKRYSWAPGLSSYLQGGLGGNYGCLLDVKQHVHRCLGSIRRLHEYSEDPLVDREVNAQTLARSGGRKGEGGGGSELGKREGKRLEEEWKKGNE
jgi:hypothetical protein